MSEAGRNPAKALASMRGWAQPEPYPCLYRIGAMIFCSVVLLARCWRWSPAGARVPRQGRRLSAARAGVREARSPGRHAVVMHVDRERISAVLKLIELGWRFEATSGSPGLSSGDKLQACISNLTGLRVLLISVGCSAGRRASCCRESLTCPGSSKPSQPRRQCARSLIITSRQGARPTWRCVACDSSDQLASRGKHALLRRRH